MSFNDDDFYVIEIATMRVVGHVGCKAGYCPSPKWGQMVVKGWDAKDMKLN